jgi:hypothetical protein
MRFGTRVAETAAALATAVAVAAALALASVALRAAPAKPSLKDFAGTWVLDERTTSGPEKPAGPEGRGEGAGGRGGNGLPGGISIGGLGAMTSPGGISGPPDREKIARHRRIAEAELAAPHRIVVSAEGNTLVVTLDDGRPETIQPDGKRHLRLTGDGEITTVTRWRDGVLVSERRYDEGITAIRTYTVGAGERGARRLTVTLKLSGGLTPKKLPEIIRVYLST